MINGVLATEEAIINNLIKKEIKVKKRAPDDFYHNGSVIFFNEDGIFFSANDMETAISKVKELKDKFKGFVSFLDQFEDKLTHTKY